MSFPCNANPAASPFSELFDDGNLEQESPYLQAINLLRRYLDTQPKFGPECQNLVDLLNSPAVAVPLSALRPSAGQGTVSATGRS